MMTVEKKPILLRNGDPQGNPMNAPRCGAKARKGTPCRAPGMPNGHCQMHGGKSTGPRTEASLARSRKARYTRGRYSVETKMRRREMRKTRTAFSAYLTQIGGPLRSDDPVWVDMAAMLGTMLDENTPAPSK